MALARWEHDFTIDGKLLTGPVQVTVRRMTGGTPQLYADFEGNTPLGNPFANDGGTVGFHVEGGLYRVKVQQGGYERELTYVAIGLAAGTDLTVATPAGEWSAETSYIAGQYVTHEGEGIFISMHDANEDNEPDTTPASDEHWMYVPGLIGPAGKIDSSNDTVLNIISVSQADYDLLDPPDETTLYIITEE